MVRAGYLLGYPDVRNSDGSWKEWGNLVPTPVEKTIDQHTRSVALLFV